MRILLLTLHSQNNNFGSVLQAHSLYTFLTKTGNDVTILDYRPYYSNGSVSFKALIKRIAINLIFFPFYIVRSKRFNKIIKMAKRTKKITKYDDLLEESKNYDVYLIGSDQVWNPNYLCGRDKAYTFSYINNVCKMSYGSSIGEEAISFNDFNNLLERLKDFEFVSFRENYTAQYFRKNGLLNTSYVLDSAFLSSRDYYKTLQSDTKESNYILAYIINKDPFMEKVIDKIASKTNKKIIQIGGFAKKCKYNKFYRSAGPKEFLGLIDKADLVVTSSFHGLVFSCIYRKEFVVVMPKKSILRIKDLLTMLGLEKRVISNIDDIAIIDDKIDYKNVDIKIEKLILESKKYLFDSLKFVNDRNECDKSK